MGKKLGKGNFGDVYLVKHKILGFLFALKIIPKQVVK
jgi:serine/threonine protein kinase